MQRGISAAQALLLSCLLLAGLESGCAGLRSTARSHSNEKLYIVTADSTPFYHYSPRQGNGPDKNVPHGTQIRLIRRSPDFCKVQLAEGEDGFIANKDIGPAAGTLIASSTDTTPEKPMAGSSEWRAEIPQPRSSAPEPPLPVSEPTPIPVPGGFGR